MELQEIDREIMVVLLNNLKQDEGWMTIAEIADSVNLNSGEAGLLMGSMAHLEEYGIAETRQLPSSGGVPVIQFRAKSINLRALLELPFNKVRAEIGCVDIQRMWFEMARAVYVENREGPQFPRDFEIGKHVGGCQNPACAALKRAYEDLLRGSTPADSKQLAEAIDKLEASIAATDN